MLNNDKTPDSSSDNTPSQMNGEASDSTPSKMNGEISDSTPSQMHDGETDASEGHGADSQIPDSGLIEETEPTIERPKADYQLIYTTAYHQIYSIVGEGRRYILKAIKPSAGDKKRQENLLKREYTLLSQLECPYIVRVWKLRNDPKVGLAIVMEYVDGQPLDKWLKTKPSEAQKQQILSELLEAIQYLHNKQIVHDDLKPQNILVAGNHVKLLDVGFSDKDEFTQSNIGYTPGYAAPEQTAGGTTDSRTDIYAIGALIRLLFPHKYLWVVRRCMRPNPQKRYASVADIQQTMHTTSISKKISGILCFVLLLIGGFVLLPKPQIGSLGTAEALTSDTAEAIVSDTVFVSTPDTIFVPLQQENILLAPPIIERDTIVQRVADSIATTTVIQHDTVFIMDSMAYQKQRAAEIAQYKESLRIDKETDSLFKILKREYDSIDFCYERTYKKEPYAKYSEIAEILAEFFALDVRFIIGKYAKQHPNDHNPDYRFFHFEDGIRNKRYDAQHVKRSCLQEKDETIINSVLYRASQLNDSLDIYRRLVDSFFSEDDLLNYAPDIKISRESAKKSEKEKQEREALRQRILNE